MAKIVLNNLANLQNETSAVNIINTNNDAIEAAMENTLSRDGTAPNQMGANFDMNSNRILNLPEPISDTEPVRLTDLEDIVLTSGTGNVVGPVSAVSSNLVMFSGTSGKIIGDSGTAIGTSGAKVGLLNANKTDSGTNTFSGVTTLSNASNSINGATIGANGIVINGPTVVNSTLTLPANIIANASLATMSANTVKGSIAGGTPADLTATQLTTIPNTFTSSLKGLAPSSGGGTLNYLRADGTWAIPPGNRQLVQTLTASNSATLGDTACFTSTYSSYEIEFIDILGATASQTLRIEVYSGSFQSSNYITTAWYNSGGGAGQVAPSGYIPANATSIGSNATVGYTGQFKVQNPTGTSNRKMWNGIWASSNSGLANIYSGQTSGVWNNTAAITGFRIYFDSGNITSGQIKIYGII